MANNQEPRILIFSMTYLPFVGGAEMAVKEITDRLNDFNFDLITAQLDKKLPEFEKTGNLNVYRVGQGWILDKYLFPFLAYFKAKKLHQKKNYQIVQAIMAFYAGLAALFFKWRYPQVKYLLTMQSGDSDFFIWLRTWFWYPLYRQIYTKPDYIQAISHFLLVRAQKYGYRGEGEIVSNGVDIEKFKKQDSKIIQGLKLELGIKPEEKVILTVSRLVYKNGVDRLIKSVKYLDFPFKLIIAGKGKDKRKLKSLAKKAGLEEKILFLGHIDYNDLPKYYSITDVFVRTSRSEGFGNVFLESLACGTPIVGTAPGGSSLSILSGAKAGLLCGVIDPLNKEKTKEKQIVEDIAKKIKRTVFNNMSKFVQRGQEMIEEEYAWDIIARKMRKIYQKLS